ncbi:MAG: alpha/beta hydrolase [Deltaproteobacteria bacterium]|nr:alpha/beta hydrolase [Deltaproteobacteria bacterium]
MDARLLRVTARDGGTAALLARPADGPERRATVLLVPGFGQNRLTWEVGDLSLPARLAALGHPTYTLEQRGTGLARRFGQKLATSTDELLADLLAALDLALEDSGADRVVLVGHSLGGLLALRGAAARPERVAGVLTLAAGLFLGRGSPLLHTVLRLSHLAFPPPLAARLAGRTLPLGVVGTVLLALRPVLDHPAVPFPLPVWAPRAYTTGDLEQRFGEGMDRVSVGVAVAVRDAFAGDGFPGVPAGEIPALLARVRCPVLLIHSMTDPLSPPPVGEPVPTALTSSPDARLLVVGRPPEPPLGHCDVVVSEHARAHVWPHVVAWLDNR